MKVIFYTFFACLALFPALQAIPSDLNQSIREYKAILDSPLLKNAIGENEFIFDVERKTQNIDSKIAIYEITTHSHIAQPQNPQLISAVIRQYRVKIKLSPNPEIGPKVITVLSVKPITRHSDESSSSH